MRKHFRGLPGKLAVIVAILFPGPAFADLSGTVTLMPNRTFSFDTGVSAGVGGDVLWTGSQLNFQGATVWGILGTNSQAAYDDITLGDLESGAFQYGAIPAANMYLRMSVGVRTGTLHFAKMMITGLNGMSVSFEFETYSVAVPSAPIITQVSNNYSYFLPGVPNYGIAPGGIVYIGGGWLADPSAQVVLQSSAPPGLPLELNGASVSVSVGGTTVHPGIYYATAGQLAVVLPSDTPVGNGTLTVTYQGNTSQPANIVVLPSAPGFVTYYGTASGLGAITDPVTGAVFDYAHSARPGGTVVLWGSGLGGVTGDSDTVFTATPHASTSPLQVFIGGIPASIRYAGNSGYPGLNQINVEVPSSVAEGCSVTVVAVSGSIVSNTITLPISGDGGPCSDPALGVSGTVLQALSAKDTVRIGEVDLYHFNTPPDFAGASFAQVAGSSYGALGPPTSLGNCTISQLPFGAPAIPSIPLDGGAVSITGPAGTAPMGNLPSGFIPDTGGTFLFAGAGGADVPNFTATVEIAAPLIWTNAFASSTVARSQGQIITWSGGAPNSIVMITGGPRVATLTASSFTCWADAAAGQFTAPSWALLAMPAGAGSIGVANISLQEFTASGIDIGIAKAIAAQSSASKEFF